MLDREENKKLGLRIYYNTRFIVVRFRFEYSAKEGDANTVGRRFVPDVLLQRRTDSVLSFARIVIPHSGVVRY